MNSASAKAFSSQPQNPAAFEEVTRILGSGVDDGAYPGAVLLVAQNGEIAYLRAVGKKFDAAVVGRDAPTMSVDTVFDVATLTNVVATTATLMRLFEQSKFKLDDRVAMYLQAFSVHHKSPITIGHLLSHTSGLPASWPFHEELQRENAGARMGILTSRGARDYIINAINRSALKYPVGARQGYSDVGMILLGHLIEIMTGLELDKAVQRYVMQPLGMKSTSYIDVAMLKRRGISAITDVIAPTEQCAWRKRILWGEAFDDNAWAMGGVAGHSGLFSTAQDLHLFAREIIAALRNGSQFLKRETVSKFVAPQVLGEASDWRLGFDGASRENGMSESKLSDKAIGVNGLSGCSLWIEPESGTEIILMSNRVHPSRHNKKIQALRPQLHSAVLDALQNH